MNPYKILNLELGADKKNIVRAVAKAMRDKKYSAKEIALAQKTLLNPVKRVADLFNNVDFSVIYNKHIVRQPAEKSVECLRVPVQPEYFT